MYPFNPFRPLFPFLASIYSLLYISPNYLPFIFGNFIPTSPMAASDLQAEVTVAAPRQTVLRSKQGENQAKINLASFAAVLAVRLLNAFSGCSHDPSELSFLPYSPSRKFSLKIPSTTMHLQTPTSSHLLSFRQVRHLLPSRLACR